MTISSEIRRSYEDLLEEVTRRVQVPFSLVLILSINDEQEGQLMLVGPEPAGPEIAHRLRVCADIRDQLASAAERAAEEA